MPDSLVILPQADGTTFHHCCDAVMSALQQDSDLQGEHYTDIQEALNRYASLGPELVSNSVAIIYQQLRTPGPDAQLLVRLDPPLAPRHDVPEVIHFLWVLLSHSERHPHIDAAAEFTHLMDKPAFREAVLSATSAQDLRSAYQRFLDQELHFPLDEQPELLRTGRLLGGLAQDIQRRFKHYRTDFTDGLRMKSVSSTFFLFFACFAATIAFGGLTAVLTKGEIGTVETILAGAIGGIAYALLSGQPLTIVGATGPVVVFIGILWSVCDRLGIPFTSTYALVGLWTTVFLLVLSAVDACSLIRFFTRFTDDTFAALISVIFIVEAVKDVADGLRSYGVETAAALLQLLLALGTYGIARKLSRLRRTPYLRGPIREFLSDFGPTIAIALMCTVAAIFRHVPLETLSVPDAIVTTSGRAWLVNPFDAPKWVWFASAIPAALVTILVFLDQNITTRLVNHPANRLQKGAAYHLDLTVVGVMIGAFSLFGLPWVVAATVRSLNHVHSLATYERLDDGRERIVSVAETRVTGLLIHALIGLSVLFLFAAKFVPMSVLFGLFLYLGVTSLSSNDLWERLRLWFIDPALYPPTHYLRAVPVQTVHTFTAIQLAGLIILWVVKVSPAGIVFPLFIVLLVPLRMLMSRYFKAEHLALLDAAEELEDEELREVGP